MPQGQKMGSAVSVPTVQKETLWTAEFRSYIMSKKELELGLERWAGREKSRAFPTNGLVISAAVIHHG